MHNHSIMTALDKIKLEFANKVLELKAKAVERAKLDEEIKALDKEVQNLSEAIKIHQNVDNDSIKQ